MKKFYSILIGLIFLGFLSEANASLQQQRKGEQSAKSQRQGKVSGKAQKGIRGKSHVAKGKGRQQSAGANTCTTKEIVTVVKGSKLLAHGKGSPALKATYKKMLNCYSKIKGKKVIPKPLQSFAKGMKSTCAKRTTPEMRKVFAKTCGNSKVSAGANACITKDIVAVVKGSKLLAHGKGSPALKATYKKILSCYSKIKGKKAIPKPLQSFAKGLKAACAKRKTPEMRKVFAKTCGAIKRKAPPPQQVADDDDTDMTDDTAPAADDDDTDMTDDTAPAADDDDADMTDDAAPAADDDDTDMTDDGSSSDDGFGGAGDSSGGNSGFDTSGGFGTSGGNSGYPMNNQNGYPQQGGYSDPSMGYPPQSGGYPQPYGGGYGYPNSNPNPNMNGSYGGSNLGF